jgi:hypothetical protein
MHTMFTTILPELQILRPGFTWDSKEMTFRETSGRHNIQKVHMQGQFHYFNGRYMKEVKRGKSTSVSFSPPKDSIKFKVVIQINQWNRAQAFLEKSVYQRTTWESNESGPLVRIIFNVYFLINYNYISTRNEKPHQVLRNLFVWKKTLRKPTSHHHPLLHHTSHPPRHPSRTMN